MIWAFIIIFSFYTILISFFAIGFVKLKTFNHNSKALKTKFSILIPFRNEAENLPILLKSIAELNYPKEFYELIFIDDNSMDNSVNVIKKFFPNFKREVKIITNKITSNSPKKDAITTAIKIAKYPWIVTTDADCLVPVKWLQTLDNFIQQKNPKMVVSPVTYQVKNNFLHHFQLLDFMSMQGITIGGFGIGFPFMCNGANLAYKKEIFTKLNGFKGNNHIASGDDIFLLEKFLENDKKSVHFLKSKEAIVTTFPVNTCKDLINQRVRWAAKTGNFKSITVLLIGLLILAINISLLTSFFNAIFQLNSYLNLLSLFACKCIIDLFLFIPTVIFFNEKKTFIKYYFLSSLVYPFFSIWVIYKSIFSNYHWKGRSFKK